MRKFDTSKDYYEILGVKEGASKGEIDRSYRTLARDQHPDRGGSEEGMKSLNEAREVLTDPDMRHAYDRERMPERIPTGSSAASFDPNAASKAGTLEINVSDEDVAGLIFAAATCFGIGVPLLILIEMQWVFFLWPLRFLTIGAIGLGVMLAHAAMRAKQRRAASNSKRRSIRMVLACEAVFWLLVLAFGYLLYFFLYSI